MAVTAEAAKVDRDGQVGTVFEAGVEMRLESGGGSLVFDVEGIDGVIGGGGKVAAVVVG